MGVIGLQESDRVKKFVRRTDRKAPLGGFAI